MRVVRRIKQSASRVALHRDSIALRSDTVVGISFPVLTTDSSVSDVPAKMTTEVLFDVSALSLVENTNVSALGLARVRVRSAITSTDWVDQFWITSAFVCFVISQTFSFVVNGDTLASSLACVLIGVAISTAHRESNMSTRIASGQRTGGSSITVISGANTILIFLRSCAFQITFVVVSKTVSSADWGLQTFTV